MPTIVVRSIVEESEALARRILSSVDASWSFTNSQIQYVSVAGAATVNLPAYTTYMLVADPASSVIVGWVYNANTVEMPVNGLCVVAPPATPYLRNPALSTTTAVPVKVISFT